MNIFLYLALSALTSPTQIDEVAVNEFKIPTPSTTGRTLRLYSTRYYVHYVAPVDRPDAAPLFRRDGGLIGPRVSPKDFCFGALQGTIAIRDGGSAGVYNVDQLAPRRSATCKYRKLSPAVNDRLGRQAWTKLSGNGLYGLGVDGLRLVPFRTIAVDRMTMPIGTVLFIPKLEGVVFDHEGVRREHDGYVIAGDVGGDIKGIHIDFFTGNFTGPPPSFVTSTEDGLFDAHLVTDPSIIKGLKSVARYIP